MYHEMGNRHHFKINSGMIGLNLRNYS